MPLMLLLGSLVFSPGADAQRPDTLWTRTFGGSNIDVGYAVQQTRDGGFVVTGYTRSFGSMSGRNVMLLKTSPSGHQQWVNAYGGNNDDEGNSVQQTSDGGYIITGYTKSSGAGGNDVFLVKTDSAGNASWSPTFGGASDEEGYAVQQTADGGYIIAGATSSFGAGSRDVWLLKTNASGVESWRRTHGGFGSDGARSVRQTADGGFIVTGWTFSYGPGAVGNAWLLKTDTAGYAVWNRVFGGTDADRGLDVQQTRDGGYVITGYTASSGAGLDDMLLIKTDSAGNGGWSRTFGGTGRDYGNSVQQTSDGGFIVAGYTLSFGAGSEDVWLVRIGEQGNQTGSATFGGSASDVAYSIRGTSDGGYIVAGHTLSYGAGVHDVWLLRVAAGATGLIEGARGIARDYRLLQNYPNPANPGTTIRYAVPARSHVTLAVFTTLGQQVATLEDGEREAGTYEVQFDASGLTSGVYLYRLRAGEFTQTRKLVVLR